MGFDLIAYGLVMAGLGLATAWLASGLSTLAFIAGLSGCGTGLLWGVLALRGHRYRNGAIVTLAIVSCLALLLSVSTWQLDREITKTRMAVAVTSLMLFFSLGQMIILIRNKDKGWQK